MIISVGSVFLLLFLHCGFSYGIPPTFQKIQASDVYLRFLQKNFLVPCQWIVLGTSLESVVDFILDENSQTTFGFISHGEVNHVPEIRRHSSTCVFISLKASVNATIEFLRTFKGDIFSPQRYFTTYVALIIPPANFIITSEGIPPEDEILSSLTSALRVPSTRTAKERVLEILNHPFKVILEPQENSVSMSTFTSIESFPIITAMSISDFYTSADLFPPTLVTNGRRRILRGAPNAPATCDDLMKKSGRRVRGQKNVIKELFPVIELVIRLNFTCEVNFSFRNTDPFNVMHPDIMLAVPILKYYYGKFDISSPLYTNNFGFCYLRSELQFSPKNIYKPLSDNVWVIFIFTWIISSLTFYLTMRHGRQNNFTTLSSCFWQLFGSLLHQEIPVKILNRISENRIWMIKPLKLFFIFWLPFVIIMHVAYTSNLVSILTSPTDSQEIPQSFGDLLDFKWSYGSPHAVLFDKLNYRNSLDYLTKGMTHFRTESLCLENLLNSSRFACLGVVSSLEQFAHIEVLDESNADRFVIVNNKTLPTVAVGLGWRWSLPFRQTFHKLVDYLIQGGFPLLWSDQELRHLGIADYHTEYMNPVRVSNIGGSTLSLNTEHLEGCFLILVGGWVLAFSVITIEKIIFASRMYMYRRRCVFLK